MKYSVRRFFGLDEEEYLEEQTALPTEQGSPEDYGDPGEPLRPESREAAAGSRGSFQRPNVIPMGQRSSAAKASIHVLEPRVYSESEEIAELLVRSEAVLLNFRRMEKEAASRVLDFLQGAVYALRGEVQEVGEGIFLFVPANIEITGTAKDLYEDNYY